MATTIVPAYDGPIPPFEPGELRALIREILVNNQGDSDKSTDPEDVAYYDGGVDVATAILEWLGGAR
jgi:hypothetical protein